MFQTFVSFPFHDTISALMKLPQLEMNRRQINCIFYCLFQNYILLLITIKTEAMLVTSTAVELVCEAKLFFSFCLSSTKGKETLKLFDHFQSH